jgi:hypothetical protein
MYPRILFGPADDCAIAKPIRNFFIIRLPRQCSLGKFSIIPGTTPQYHCNCCVHGLFKSYKFA